MTPRGDRPIDNELLAMHLSSESPTPTTAKGQTLDVWKRRPDAENHWFDGMVGAAVAASMQGAVLFGAEMTRQRKKPMRLSDLRAKP